jgi:dTDP-4-dehydrorhamnose 3,5-epimerase
MKKIETPISDLYIIEPEVYGDDRGYFFESFNAEKFEGLGLHTDFRQANESFSTQGVLRGIHFQHHPKPMAKLVRCPVGRLWDVAVDLRKDSPTYKQWYGVELSADNRRMLMVPVGFGHGFYAITDCMLSYMVSNTYEGSLDAGIAWDDPSIDIQWPLIASPSLSEKDQTLPLLRDVELTW